MSGRKAKLPKAKRGLLKAERRRPRIVAEETENLDQWLTDFVRIHAVLFLKFGERMWRREGREISAHWLFALRRTETLPALRSKLLDTFPKLLSSLSLDSDTLLRITIINQAAFYTLQCLEATGESSSKAIKGYCKQEVLILIIEFFSMLLRFVEEAVRDIALPPSRRRPIAG